MRLPGSLGGHGKHALRIGFFALQKYRPVCMPFELCVLVIIQPRAAHVFVVHGKAQRLNQMQHAACVGGQADHVAGIRWDFRLDQNNVKHSPYCDGHRLQDPPYSAFSVRAKTKVVRCATPAT